MAGKLEKAILSLHSLNSISEGMAPSRDSRCSLLVTLAYLGFMLSVPLQNLSAIILFGIYPVMMASMTGIGFGKVLLKSLWVLPLVVAVGIFNPWIDRETAFTVSHIAVSRGWVSFISITLRGIMAVQAVVILLMQHGFPQICKAMERLGVPAFLTVQLGFVYRYVIVLLQEALSMQRAREARCYGKRHMNLQMWGVMMGQLFIRTLNRAERIHQAMLARGFTGVMKAYNPDKTRWQTADTIFVMVWLAIFATLRFINFNALFHFPTGT